MPLRPTSGVTLDAFTDRYAQRTHGMTASEIRALFAVASRPEVVSLAGGMPNLSALPLDAVGKLMGEAPSYVGALGTFAAYQAEVVHVAMDEHGLVPEALREAITAVRAAGRRA